MSPRYFPKFDSSVLKHCTTNSTLLAEFQTVVKYRTNAVRTWLRLQRHYPSRPHFYSIMTAHIAQLEDMPNVYNLRIDGARECYGCSIECDAKVLFHPVGLCIIIGSMLKFSF